MNDAHKYEVQPHIYVKKISKYEKKMHIFW